MTLLFDSKVSLATTQVFHSYLVDNDKCCYSYVSLTIGVLLLHNSDRWESGLIYTHLTTMSVFLRLEGLNKYPRL